MNVAIIIVVVVAVAAILIFAWRTAGRTWLRYRGSHVVECPETRRPVAVDIDAKHAARGALSGHPELRLSDCTRWPERAECGQECLTQIAESPTDCAVKTILTQWYAGSECAMCGKTFDAIHWHDHRPCLLAPNGEPLDWTDFRPEDIRTVLETHRPICWNCHVAEKFRRDNPDRIVDRHR